MRVFIFSLVFYSLVAVNVLAQNHSTAKQISGQVFKAGTNEPVSDALVYYDGSMSGTVSGKEGQFTLKSTSQQIPVIVSCAGYYSATVAYEAGKPLAVYLKPKEQGLEAAANSSRKDGMKRKEEVELFLKTFIGPSEFAVSCTIANINDVQLFYDRKTKTLTAGCAKPILIENKALGYSITYFLDKFERSPSRLTLNGNCLFKETLTTIPDSVKDNREKAYIGSRMQFIRNLWSHKLTAVGYRVYDLKHKPVYEENIITTDALQQKYLSVTPGLFVINNYTPKIVSNLYVSENPVYIDKMGYCGSGNLQWIGGGSLGWQQLADLLPYEYQSDKEKRILEVAAALTQK